MLQALFDRSRLMLKETRAIRVSFVVSLMVLVLNLGLAVWLIAQRLGSPILALHYTVYFGVDWVGSAWGFLAAPGLGALLLLANMVLATDAYVRNRWVGVFLAIFTLIMQSLLAVSTCLNVISNI